MDDAYSSFGRTYVKYASCLTSGDADFRLRRRKPSLRRASEHLDCTCGANERDWFMCTPRYLYKEAESRGSELIKYV